MLSFYRWLFMCLWSCRPPSECVNEHSWSSLSSCFLLPTVSGGSTVGRTAGWFGAVRASLCSGTGRRGWGRWKDQIETLKSSSSYNWIMQMQSKKVPCGLLAHREQNLHTEEGRSEHCQVSFSQVLAFHVKVSKALLLYCGARIQNLDKGSNSED